MEKKITHCGQMSQVHLRIKESGVNALRLRLEFAITRGDQGLIDWAYQCVREYYGCSVWFIIYVYIHEYVSVAGLHVCHMDHVRLLHVIQISVFSSGFAVLAFFSFIYIFCSSDLSWPLRH